MSDSDNSQGEIRRPKQFRILIIGRANAGKTTILRAVCGAEGEPDVYDRDGNKITPEVHPDEVPDAALANNEAVPDAPRAESEDVQDAALAESGEVMPGSTRVMLRTTLRTNLRTTLRTIRARIMCRPPDSSAPSNLLPSLHSRETRNPILAPNSVLIASPDLAPLPHLQENPNSILAPSALRGEHNVEYSLIFPSSPGFVFHDSRGFESGAVDELELVRKFIRDKASLGSMKNQLHAIWYCFSTDSNRFMTAADKEFFDTIDTGTVPVIAIFTKFDALDSVAFSALSTQGVPFEEAQKRAPEHAQANFDHNLLPLIKKVAYPPRAVACLRNMHNTESPDTIQKAASELVERTEAALDNDALKVLLIQAQRANVELCMTGAVNSGVITKAAQDALQQDPTTFNPLQDELIQEIFKWFPSIWVGSTTMNHFSYPLTSNSLFLLQTSWTHQFISVITPLITSSLHSMPPALQIISVGCAAVIIAAKTFWLRSGTTYNKHIITASQEYFQSSTAGHVRVAILEAFKGASVLYDTPESVAALEQVVLKNKMSESRPGSIM
ncbi:hypothetical protein BOTBODRAFT_35289 [Botryobasidium botryosum FD-172 SS1]|uniref:G domain-containing protein n=1 Tax=Botryobasidium botryosum (strain FD-172 SS1) TaxID=930990 RepID=A0A067MAA1_BOTB1|nr:hypothetical protein BOTBODRAFT_35289 [Botryobasidium botryosum FD-172 SS1]